MRAREPRNEGGGGALDLGRAFASLLSFSSSLSSRAAAAPFASDAFRVAMVSVLLLASLALSAAGVRVLPWLLDPQVPWRVAMPFARAVASVALEAAVLVGWPIGVALAAFAFAERGEARVLALLGERPSRTALRLVPIAIVFGGALAVVSLAGGRDASEPGRVVAELLAQGRASCGRPQPHVAPRAVDVPIVHVTWLCEADGHGDASGPRLVGAPPFTVTGPGRDEAQALYSARAIDVSPDARHVTLDDAWLALATGMRVHVGHAVFHLPPFTRASALPPAGRAALLALAGAASSILAAWSVLFLAARRESTWRLHALALGSAGPVGALTLLHALERADAQPVLYLSLPAVAIALPAVLVALLTWFGGARG